ncbi:MAG TPA: hypothetical protein VF669_14510 [Tepidisphaeraceae bacterium]|jgi:DNA-directed RNA polymerase subunit RPC12/RpoP
MSETSEVISVRCNHCGAPLEVSRTSRFVTCSYCKSQLEIRRSGSAVYTEVLEQIEQRTQRIEEDVQAIKLQNEIEALDREWEAQRQSLMVRNKHGVAQMPSVVGGAIGAVFAVVVGIGWIAITTSFGAPGFFPLFGVLFILLGVVGGITSMVKAGAYQNAEADYLRRREKLRAQTRSDPIQRQD